nr:capsular polysaccharide biosynthesis protein [Propylenella binzhouense]
MPAVDAVARWGEKAPGRRATAVAARAGIPLVSIEDGFLRSVRPGRGERSLSYVVDRTGIYYASARPNDLRGLIAAAPDDPGEAARARAGIELLRSRRLSKYNDGRLRLPESLREARDFVLVVDQSLGDASIAGAGAGPDAFEAALAAAAREHPGRTILVKTHPDNARAGSGGHLAGSAERYGATITAESVNPWLLLERCRAAYVVSSLLGFEALMAGVPVVCFGAPFYAGWGLTDDRAAVAHGGGVRSLEQVFAAAYFRYARYLDPYNRREVAFEQAAEHLAFLRDRFHENSPRTVTAGFSPWRRRAVAPFLDGPEGPPLHRRDLAAAAAEAARIGGRVAVWSAGAERGVGAPALLRLEDGFLRSRGLGAALTLPASLILDPVGLYFDARHPSRFEEIAGSTAFDEAILARAARLREQIVATGITKYNVGEIRQGLPREEGRLRILVPGQVEDDASIRFGSPALKSNLALLEAVRSRFPGAFVLYKPHPDVEAAMRRGRIGRAEALRHADDIVFGAAIGPLFAWCDRVETMTSLAGFEALMRGKPVGTHGLPFYAGWGLTDDRLEAPRRGRRLSLDMLVAAALILYPRYVDPKTRLPCPPELVVERLAAPDAGRRGAGDLILDGAGFAAGWLRNRFRR